MMKKCLSLCAMCLAAVFVVAGCGDNGKQPERQQVSAKSNAPIDGGLCRRLNDFAVKPRPQGQMAFEVYDLTADALVACCNPDQALPSASCMKLLTGIAGLHLLGADYCFPTTIFTKGLQKGDTFAGDVYLRATFDPQLDGSTFDALVRPLRRKGIRRVDGRLVLDLLMHEPIKGEEHWYAWDLSFSRYGVLYKGADRVKREALAAFARQGISISKETVCLGKVDKGAHGEMRYLRGLNPVLKRMWKNSSNTQATSLLYAIGHRADPKKAPEKAGVDYLVRFLRSELGQMDTALVVHDGCGLCTYNRLSPHALNAILRYGYANPEIRRKLFRFLSVAGVDGTLARVMSGAKTRGKVWAKTGTLSHPYGISSLAGFCASSNGHQLVFCIMCSEMSVLDAHVLQRKFCEELVE